MEKRIRNGEPLKQVIEDWLASHPKARKVKETRILHLWGEFLGTFVKNRTESIYLNRNTLHVKLNSAVLRNELTFAKTKIMKEINDQMGENVIDDIILK